MKTSIIILFLILPFELSVAAVPGLKQKKIGVFNWFNEYMTFMYFSEGLFNNGYPKRKYIKVPHWNVSRKINKEVIESLHAVHFSNLVNLQPLRKEVFGRYTFIRHAPKEQHIKELLALQEVKKLDYLLMISPAEYSTINFTSQGYVPINGVPLPLPPITRHYSAFGYGFYVGESHSKPGKAANVSKLSTSFALIKVKTAEVVYLDESHGFSEFIDNRELNQSEKEELYNYIRTNLNNESDAENIKSIVFESELTEESKNKLREFCKKNFYDEYGNEPELFDLNRLMRTKFLTYKTFKRDIDGRSDKNYINHLQKLQAEMVARIVNAIKGLSTREREQQPANPVQVSLQ